MCTKSSSRATLTKSRPRLRIPRRRVTPGDGAVLTLKGAVNDMPEQFEIYSVITRDGGKTFTAPFKVSTAPSPGVTRRRGMRSLGRDFVSVALDDDFVHMTWFDDRAGFRATWYARVPLHDYK